jgi:2'-5' RNA ligase
MAGYDDNTEKYLAAIQNRLYENGFVGTHTKNLPQHITLGTFSVEKETEIIDLINNVANESKPFKITFNHIGIFSGSKVLFVAPDPNVNLLKLKECFGDNFDWTPHTTMLIDNPENIYASLPIVAENFVSFEGRVENIHLYEFWPLRHILSLSLGK